MKFQYKKYGPFLRPVISIRLKHKEIVRDYEVLVDSGADVCIFDSEIGELLGIDILSGRPEKVTGVAGQSSVYFVHSVEVVVGGWPHTIEAGFMPHVAGAFNYGVVGQKGFFDNFIVKFDLLKEEVELKQRTK